MKASTVGGPTQGALEVIGLSKRYGQIPVANELRFRVERGECLGVIGPNGAGKSSLFNLITGAARADSGRIELDGRDITDMTVDARARIGVARAFQIPQPFAHLSVYENALASATFAAGLTAAPARLQAAAALERTGLAGRANEMAGRLSLIDRKRLELAKGLAANPRVLLLDEIAGGLTEPEVRQLVALIRELKPQVAMLWIEHIALALSSVADRIMVLDFGSKLLEDSPEKVMDSSAVREIYMGASAQDATAEVDRKACYGVA